MAVLAGASGGLLYATRKARQAQKDPFEDIINPAVARAYPSSHVTFTRQGAQKYNPIMNLMNPQNIILPKDFSSSDLNSMETKIKQAVQTVVASPNDPSFLLTKGSTANIQLNPLGKGTKGIEICERVKTLNCDAFDSADFAEMCGVCHEQGENSQSQPVIGGLFVTADAKANAEGMAKRQGSRTVSYVPSVGKCAPGRFSTSKEQCKRMQKEMECEKKQTFETEDCAQCVQDERFQYLSPDLIQDSPSLVVVGTGSLKVSGSTVQPATKTLSNSPQQISLEGIKEGDTVTLEVSISQGSTPTLAGYLIGTTVGGDYRMDLIRLIQVDTETGSKPRLIGNQDVGGDLYSLMRSGAGKSTMRLQMLNTFTFVSANEAEAQRCGSAPFITKESSAAFLNSGPCYVKGQKPGAYSLNCIQQTFLDAGCTSDGEGFPNNEAKARQLMVDTNGNPLSVGAIANTIYQKAQIAYTGRDAAGNKLSIPDWDTVSRFCTGKRIVSPCDYDNQESGPLSKECLNYLWTNSGANVTNMGTGPTYTGGQLIASLNQQNKNRFCTSNGTMAPIDQNGKETAAAAVARAKGGVKAVKQFYNTISLKANDNTLSDSERQEAVQQCYGINFSKPNSTLPGAGNVAVPASGLCVPTTIISQVTGPMASKNYGQFTFKTNTTITFTIRPTALETTNWASLFAFSKTLTDDLNQTGSRMPGVWFFPNSTRLHVSFIAGGQNVAVDTTNPIPLNQDTNVTLKMTQNSCTVTCTGGLNETQTRTFQSPLPSGLCSLYVVRGAYPSFKGVLTNLSYCTFDDAYPSVLDYRPGRTKTPFTESSLESPWRCYPGFTPPMRRNKQGDIECMSSDGVGCMWAGDCAPKLNTPASAVKSLACGENHKKLYGGTGYDTPTHWCSKVRDMI